MPLLLHTRYNNIKIIVTWTVLHVFFCHEVFKGEAGFVFVGLLIIRILKNLLSHFFFGSNNTKRVNLYFEIHASHAVYVHKDIRPNLCTHIYCSLQLPLSLLCRCFLCITYLL